MTKTKLETFIKKYALNGILDEVRWNNTNSTLNVVEMTADKKFMVSVEMRDFKDFGDIEFVIPNTTSLKAKIAALGDDVKISLNADDDDKKRIISLGLEDDRNELTYQTGDADHLQKKPKLAQIPEYDVEIKLTERFINDFNKAKSGFNDVNLFTLIMSKKKKKLEMVLGYSNINTDRIALGLDTIEGKDTIKEPASFSAEILKNILAANSEVKDPILRVTEQGLAHIEFDTPEFNAKYYLIEIPVED